MTPEQKAAIEALKGDIGFEDCSAHDVKWFIDRAVSIVTQRRETGPEDVERVTDAIDEILHRYGVALNRLNVKTIAQDAIAALPPAAEVERPSTAELVARGMWQVALEFGEFTEEEAICASGDDWHQYLPDAEKLIADNLDTMIEKGDLDGEQS